MKFSMDNLLEKDFHIAEKRKIIFAIPLAVVVIAVVLMIIFNFTLGAPLNLGTDFTGGYSVDVRLGNKLTDDNFSLYCDRIEEVLQSVTDENGVEYRISVSGVMQRQGTGDNSSIHVKYSAVNGVNESTMSRLVNPAIITALENNILNKIPSVEITANQIKLVYDEVINSGNEQSGQFASIRNQFKDLVEKLNTDHSANITVDDNSFVLDSESGNKGIVITSSTAINVTEGLKSALVDGMMMDDIYAGSITGGDIVGATVSTELIFNAVLAVSLALIFMLCYIGLRFQLSSGLACILALLHDLIMVFAFMAIFHVEINSTFIAALITILGYSINNSIIVFDRVRENMRSVFGKGLTPEQMANVSVKETLMRSINTTITTLIMILMVAIIGVNEIRIFAFPIIIGMLSGTFSSICIAPSLWALFQYVGNKNREAFGLPPKAKKTNNRKATGIKA